MPTLTKCPPPVRADVADAAHFDPTLYDAAIRAEGRTFGVLVLESPDFDEIGLVELTTVDGREPFRRFWAGVRETAGPWCNCSAFYARHRHEGTLCPHLAALDSADLLNADIATDGEGVVVACRRTPEPIHSEAPAEPSDLDPIDPADRLWLAELEGDYSDDSWEERFDLARLESGLVGC